MTPPGGQPRPPGRGRRGGRLPVCRRRSVALAASSRSWWRSTRSPIHTTWAPLPGWPSARGPTAYHHGAPLGAGHAPPCAGCPRAPSSTCAIARVDNLADLLLARQAAWPLELRRDGRRGDAATTGPTTARADGVRAGRRGRGLRPRVRKALRPTVSIPMHGRIDSLNVSTAAAVLLFEAARQRNGVSPTIIDGDNVSTRGVAERSTARARAAGRRRDRTGPQRRDAAPSWCSTAMAATARSGARRSRTPAGDGGLRDRAAGLPTRLRGGGDGGVQRHGPAPRLASGRGPRDERARVSRPAPAAPEASGSRPADASATSLLGDAVDPAVREALERIRRGQ